MAFSNSPRTRSRPSAARICTIARVVGAVLALLVAPLIFAVLGIILGVVGAYWATGRSAGTPRGRACSSSC